MTKKICATVLALTLTICTFTSCSKKDNSSSGKADTSSSTIDTSTADSSVDSTAEIPVASFTVDGKEIDTSDYVVMTIDGQDIDFDMFRYYYFYTISQYSSNYGVDLDTINQMDGGFEGLLEEVVNSIKQELVAGQLADENDISLDEDEEAEVDSSIESAKGQFESEEAYQDALASSYLTEDLYRKMLESASIYTKVNDTLFTNEGKYATSKADFEEIVKDTDVYCREIHVMIPYYSQVELDDSTTDSYDDLSLSEKASAKSTAYSALDDDGVADAKAAAKKVAEDVLQKAQDGEDFEKLIEEYGWDVGLEDPTAGYYFNKDTSGGYPEELVTAAFALKENGISTELVENDTYGYFVIKRLPVDMDYVKENEEDMIYSYDSPAISDLYQERMDAMEVTYCDDWDKITSESIT